jgi:hypothetical protein
MFDEQSFIKQRQKQNIAVFIRQIEAFDRQKATELIAKGYVYVKTAIRTVVFTFGEVTYSRRVYAKAGRFSYPVDDELGLLPYTRHSQELLFELAQMAAKMSYREVAKTMAEMNNIEITKDTVAKAVKLVAKLYEEHADYQYFKDDAVVEKIQVPTLYIEGDGIQVKTPKKADKRTDLAHFVVHEGRYQTGANRYALKNKYEIITDNNYRAREELLTYLNQHYDFSKETTIVTNSDMGHGYTPYVFKTVAKIFKAKHEHFWDSYHLNTKIGEIYKNKSKDLEAKLYQAVYQHSRQDALTILDTTEALLEEGAELQRFQQFKTKLLRHFQYTKPAHLRGFTHHGIGIMESENSKIAFRMKHRGMYWSLKGATTMAKMIIDVKADQLRELFFGDWRQQYRYYQKLNNISTSDYLNEDEHVSELGKGTVYWHNRFH